MKKIFTFFLFWLALGTMLHAQIDTVRIGNGSNTANYPLPGKYGWVRDIAMYTAAEMNTSGGITHIAYHVSSNSSNTNRKMKIYLMETDETELTNAYIVSWNNMKAQGHLVFETSSISFTAGWNYITLDAPFFYSGDSNLLVMIEGSGCTTTGGCTPNIYYTTTTGNLHWLLGQSTNPPHDYDMIASGGSFETECNTSRPNIIFFVDESASMTCPAVSNISATQITHENANISWVPLGSENAWLVSYKESTSSTWSDEEMVYDTNYNFLDNPLNSETQYDFRVRAFCGATDMSMYNSISFRTLCGHISVPFSDNFDTYETGSSSMPACWTKIGTYSPGVFISSNGYEGNCLYFVIMGANHSVMATTQIIDEDVDISNLVISFKYKGNSISDTLHIGVMTDPANASTFEEVAYVTGTTTWTDKEIFLSSYTNTGRYIAFKFNSHASMNGCSMDNLSVDRLPECMHPVDLTASDITSNSMDISWDDAGGLTPSSWIIRYSCDGLTYHYEAANTNPHTINNLPHNSIVSVAIAAVCNETDTTDYSEEGSFSLTCVPVTQFPWNEGFENDWVPAIGVGNKAAPNCWTVIDKGATTAIIGSREFWWTPTTAAYHAHSGTGAAQCYTNSGTSDHNDWLISPQMTLTGNERLRFWTMRANETTDEPDEISIFISDSGISLDTTGMGTYDTMPGFHRIFHQILPQGGWARYEVDLSQYSGNRYIAFVRQGTPDGYYLRLDDVSVEPLPSCMPPLSITVSNEGQTNVEINFTPANTTDSEWRLYYKTSGATAYDSTTISTLPFQLNSLTPNSTYQFYLKTDCGTALSEETSLYGFQTLCGIITSFPWSEGFENDWIPATGVGNKPSPNCWTVIDRGATHSANEYWWKQTTTASQVHSGNGAAQCYTDLNSSGDDHNDWLITPQMTLTGSERLRFWARRHSPTTDEPDEISIFISDENSTLDTTGMGIYGNMPGFTRIFHQNLPVGDWARYEVNLNQYSGNRYIAFVRQGTPNGYYLRLDDVSVEPLPSCVPPHTITVSNETANSADIDFIVGNPTDNAWRLYYKTAIDTTYRSVDISSQPPYTLTSLLPATSYQFYMETICGADEYSEASPLYFFNTACGIITSFPWSEGFENDWVPATGVGNKPAPNCWTVVDRGGSNGSYEYWWKQTTTPSDVRTGTGAAQCYTDHGTSNHNDWLISPKIRLTSNENLIFWARRGTSSITEPDEISIFISDEDMTLDTTGMGIYGDMPGFRRIFHQILPMGDWAKYEVNLNQFAGDRHIAFVRQGTPDSYYLRLDDVSIEPLSDCMPPHSITVSNITQTSADINFAQGNLSDRSWLLYYKASTASAWDSVDVYAIPAELPSLTPNTTYQYYLKTNCGEDYSTATNTLTFTTLCDFVSIPYTQNFDGTDFTTGLTGESRCWSRITDNATQGYPFISTSFTSSGTQSFFFYGYNTTYECLVAPEADDTTYPINTLKVKFKLRSTSSDVNSAGVQVGVMTNPYDYSTFEPIGGYHKSSTTSAFEQITVSLASYPGAGKHIAIRTVGPGTTSYNNTNYVDDFEIVTLENCEQPDFTFDNPTANSVDITITPGNITDSAWHVYYKEASASTWSSSRVTTNPFTLSSLQHGTSYQLYMETDCGGLSSSPASTKTFQTQCGAIVSLPITDDFDNYGTGESVMPLCWTRTTTQSNRPYITTGGVTANCLQFYAGTTGTYNIAVMPEIDASIPVNTLMVSFESKSSATDTLYIGVMTNPTHEATFELVEKVVVTNQYAAYEVPLNHYGETGQYIAFKIEYDGNASSVYMDNLVVDRIPTCHNPQNFTAAQNSPTSARLDWDEDPSVVSRILEYKLSTDATWTVDPNVTAPPYILSSLTADTTYDFRLKFNCGGTDESEYKYASAFVGYYCTPTFAGTSTISYTNTVTTTGATTTNLVDNTACTALTYYERTSLPFQVLPGDVITFTINYTGGTHGIAIWVDLDSNYSFEASERVYSTTNYMSSPHSGTITIPVSTPIGSYRVRLQVDGNKDNPSDPCQNNTGNIIDYTMVVSNPAPPTEYTITPSVEGSGSVNPSSAVQVVEGGSQTFTFTPGANYELSQVLVDNVATSYDTTGRSYTFANVQADHTIKGVFTLIGSVDDYVLNNRVIIYPNPANSTVNVKTEVMFQTVEITNILGQVIYTSFVNDTHFQLNVSHLTAGIYFIRLQGENGTAVKKLRVEN